MMSISNLNNLNNIDSHGLSNSEDQNRIYHPDIGITVPAIGSTNLAERTNYPILGNTVPLHESIERNANIRIGNTYPIPRNTVPFHGIIERDVEIRIGKTLPI